MSDRVMRDLLHEVADGVEPGERLEVILSATRRRTLRRRWVGGAALVAASVAVALALSTGAAPRGSAPEPAGPVVPAPTSGTIPREGPTTTPESPATDSSVVAIYYIGDTPRGPRLYREFRGLVGDPLTASVSAAVGRDASGRRLYPLDPDYRVVWPSLTAAEAGVDADGATIDVVLGGDPEGDLRGRGPLSRAEARLAIEALVRTAQEVVGEPLPVRLLLYGEETDRVLGVATGQPLLASSDLDVLAHVSLADPSQGLLVDNDEPFTVQGRANSFEGNVVTRIHLREGPDVVEEKPAIAGWAEDRLFPFQVTFDLTEVPTGDYVVTSRTDDPSGQGLFDVDTRVITVVD